MKTNYWILAAAGAVAALGVAGPVLAHHSYAMFDRTKDATLEGTVTEWKWTNPHSWLYVMAPAPGGGPPVVWGFESGALAQLSKMGWTRTMFKPGDRVKVLLHPRKDGGPGGDLVEVTMADGRVVSGRPGAPGGPAGPRPAAAY